MIYTHRCAKGEERYPPNTDFYKLSKRVQQVAKPISKFSIFELKSLFISCESDIPGVIAFYTFPRESKKSLSSE